MRINKLAAAATTLAATALVAAAPMAMAGSFTTGTVTALNPARGTISIDGARYVLTSGALKAGVKTGDLVAYKTNDHGMDNAIYAVQPTANGAVPAASQETGALVTKADFFAGEQKAIADGLEGPQIRARTVPATQIPEWSGERKEQALTNATGGVSGTPVHNIVS